MTSPKLSFALQMDPVAGIDITGDSTFALGLEAQSRGHNLWYYTPENLSFNDGKVTARVRTQVAQSPQELDGRRDLRVVTAMAFNLSLSDTFADSESYDVFCYQLSLPSPTNANDTSHRGDNNADDGHEREQREDAAGLADEHGRDDGEGVLGLLQGLVRMRDAILKADPAVQPLLRTVLSSILIKTSFRESDTSNHRSPTQRPPGTTLTLFHKKARLLGRSLEMMPANLPVAGIHRGDARITPAPHKVGLILTSPPYPGVYSYLDFTPPASGLAARVERTECAPPDLVEARVHRGAGVGSFLVVPRSLGSGC